METTELVTTEANEQMLVALTPAELPAAQRSLDEWCDRKIAALEVEAKDLDEHRMIAKANSWKLGAVERQLSLARRRIVLLREVKGGRAGGLSDRP